jgi:prepilin-type N-terminal cleavage/methylation domain-containing protein
MLPPKLGKPVVGGDTGMTLLDLLIVTLILGILAAIVLPTFFN